MKLSVSINNMIGQGHVRFRQIKIHILRIWRDDAAQLEERFKSSCEREYALDNNLRVSEAKLASARAIMQRFVDKVDRGLARSTETYGEMKEWLDD